MTTEELIAYQSEMAAWRATQHGLACERALNAAENYGAIANNEHASMKRANEAHARYQSAANDLRNVIRDLVSARALGLIEEGS